MKVSFSSLQKGDPEIKGGVRIPYAPGKRKTSKLLWWSILVVVFLPFALLIWNIFSGWFFTSSPGAVTMEIYPVKAAEGGLVVRMMVEKGVELSAGAPVAQIKRITPPERLEQIALMKSERDALLSSTGPITPSSNVSTKLVDETIEYLKKESDTMRSLMNAGSATRAEVNQAEAQLRSAKADRQRIVESRVSVPLETGTNARIAYFNKSIRYLEGLADTSFEVLVTRAGRVQSIEAYTGQNVNTEDDLIWLADPSTAMIVTYVEPKNLANIKPGAEVTVVIPGTSRHISAVVEEMPTVAQNIPSGLDSNYLAGTRNIRVNLRIKEPLLDQELVEGLPVKVNWGIRFLR